ncbi:MAG: sigma-54-dependent transcriptional regulator [Planctomycetota bacterium]|jgi:CheY-like chemotaxis protein
MKKESILVVEDEEIMRESLVDWFSSEDHKVDAASDGDKALEAFDLQDYDVMIVDLKLPGKDGLSVLSEVRVKNPKAKVIIVTAYPSVDTAVEAMRRGAVDYLPKPFELDRLETSILKARDVQLVAAPPVEMPVPVKVSPVEEVEVSPCIWYQAGVIKKRMCPVGYRCSSECVFHAAMMKNEKYRSDPKIKPYLDKINSLTGKNQCRYTMSGDISFRVCPNLYHCEQCEFHLICQDEVDRQLDIKAARREANMKERL